MTVIQNHKRGRSAPPLLSVVPRHMVPAQLSDTSRSHQSSSNPSGKPRDEANGHEIILRSMIKKGQDIQLVLTSREVVRGKLRQFDHHTITVLESGKEFPETFYKHAIQSFTVSEKPEI